MDWFCDSMEMLKRVITEDNILLERVLSKKVNKKCFQGGVSAIPFEVLSVSLNCYKTEQEIKVVVNYQRRAEYSPNCVVGTKGIIITKENI